MKLDISKTLAVILFVISPVSIIFGESTEPNQFLTINDYLKYAETHNAGLKSSFQQYQAALEQVPQAKALPDPRLSYGYFLEPVETRVGPQRQRIGISQTFPWFGKIDARTDVATQKTNAAFQEYQHARLELFREVKNDFYEYAYLAGAVDITVENLELLKQFEQIAQTQYASGQAVQPDVIRAQVEIANMDYVLKSLEQFRQPAVSKLVKALSLPQDSNLPWPKVEEFNATGLDYERLVSILIQKNPQLTSLEFSILAAKSGIELAKKNFYPDISVGVDWTQTGPARMSGVEDSGKDAVMLTFSLNLPLWRDNYSAAERQARAMAAGIEQEKIDTENTLLSQAAQSYYDYNDTIRRIRLYRDALIPKGEELLRASQSAYQAGTIDFLSLIDAQRMLLGYQLSLQRAIADNRQKLAELDKLAGTELETK